MRIYKRVELDPDAWHVVADVTKHEVELPYAEDLDLWVEWRSDGDVTAWLLFTDGKEMPYGIGCEGQFAIKTRQLLSIVFKSSKKTTMALSVLFRDLSVAEKLDYTPVVIKPPRSAQIDIANLLTAEVRRQLEERGVLTPLEISEEDNLEWDDDADEFGGGYMEEDELVVEDRKARKAAAKADKASRGSSGAPGNVGAGGVGDSSAGSASPVSDPPAKP